MSLYLVRHTRVQIAPGICYGQSDIPLAETFKEEVAAVSGKLPAGDFPVYASPLSRCVRLAAQIAPAYRADERLMELNFGDWEMKTWDDIPRNESEKWMEDFVHRACPGGESYGQMAARVMPCITQIARAHPAGAVIVTHSGVIRLVWANAAGKPLAQAFDLRLDFGEVFSVDYNPSGSKAWSRFTRL